MGGKNFQSKTARASALGVSRLQGHRLCRTGDYLPDPPRFRPISPPGIGNEALYAGLSRSPGARRSQPGAGMDSLGFPDEVSIMRRSGACRNESAAENRSDPARGVGQSGRIEGVTAGRADGLLSHVKRRAKAYDR